MAMMDSNTLKDQKVSARQTARRRRRDAAAASPDAAQTVMGYLFDYLDEPLPRCVAAYLPIGSELNPTALMDELRQRGIATALPVVVDAAMPLQFRLYQPGDPLIVEKYATRAPTRDAPECLPDLILTPMLAFNRLGYRLGYGGGFYDRTIATYRENRHECRFLGLAYAAQQDDNLPVGSFDVPLEVIVTEQGIRHSEKIQ